MIGGLGAVQLRPTTGGTEAGGSLLSGAAAAAGDPGSSFMEALSRAANRTIDTLQNAEQVSIQALSGEADTRQVADAVMSAQQALQTAIAIRDKIVAAYLDISRMNI
jgi:flagellar hook-basal body complex protein FliE